MKRRQMLAAIAAAAAAPAALAAEASGAPKKVWLKVPEGWYGEGMYLDLAKDGTGVTAPGTEGLPTAAGTLDSEGVVGQAAAVFSIKCCSIILIINYYFFLIFCSIYFFCFTFIQFF